MANRQFYTSQFVRIECDHETHLDLASWAATREAGQEAPRSSTCGEGKNKLCVLWFSRDDGLAANNFLHRMMGVPNG